MKLKSLSAVLLVFSAMQLASAGEFSWKNIPGGFTVRNSDSKVVRKVEFFGKGTSVRVNTTLNGVNHSLPSICVIAQPDKDAVTLSSQDDKVAKFSDKNLVIEVNKDTLAMTFHRKDNGAVILAENQKNPVDIKEVTISDAPTYEVKQNFTLKQDESIYGLGQCVRPFLNYRGKEILVVQTNIAAYNPVITSSEGYGILWDVHSQTIYKDDASGMSLWAESAPAGSDYYLMTGNNLEDALKGYRFLTGSAPMFSKEAYGLFMCKERYKSAKEITGIVQTFRDLHFPLDYIVQDWQYWEPKNEKWCSMEWDASRYPDPEGMIKNLHDNLHVNLMISIWPTVGDDCDLARELDAKNLRFKPLHWISKNARVYDAYSEEGRQIYFKWIKKGLLDKGVDALWMDGTEVETRSACHDQRAMIRDIKENGINAMGDFTRYLNSYSLLTTKGTYEGQRATSTKRVFTLTRSAWAGQQRYGALPWSGDTTASWNCLKEQIVGGMSASLAGLPYWTQDTGGFFIGSYGDFVHNKEYQELLSRWNQFAVFNPVYRWHTSGADCEPFRFKDAAPDAYNSFLEAATLRYRLFPYTYSLAWKITSEDYTPYRALVMDFPGDKKVQDDETKFMYGPAFLVQPVTKGLLSNTGGAKPTTIVEGKYLTTPDGKPGVQIEYFNDERLRNKVSTAFDPEVNYTWPGPPLKAWPEGLRNGDHFSARVTGFITPPETGTFEIGAIGDDGFRVWIDGKQICNDWRSADPRYSGGKVELVKGQKVSFRIDYYQNLYSKQLTFVWKKPAEVAAEEAATNKTGLKYPVATELPAGADWFDFWTGKALKGGTQTATDCPLNRFPLFVRAGSIVPMADGLEYNTQKPLDDLEIRIYPGADATFTLYEDEGNNYNYEKGAYSTIKFDWNDKAGTLTIGKSQGEFPGMLKNRKFRVVLVSDKLGGGTDKVTDGAKTVEYNGASVAIKLK